MNNEIQRKITSLTLMTIMLAGGMVIAAPGMVPAAHAANANLFVSAENSQFDNYMSGPQVIEIVIIDSDIDDTDESKGEPDVTINGKDLRMVQAVDGNWYGYFADKKQALIADSTAGANTGFGLDYGGFCDNSLVLTGDTTTTFASGTIILLGATANVEAFGTITHTGAEIVTGTSITVGALTYVASSGGGAAQEFDIDGNAAADFALLQAEIQSDSTEVQAVLTSATVITVTADDGTTAAVGNALALVENTDANNVLTQSGVLLSGGTDVDTVTVNSLTYSAVTGTAADNTEFSIAGSDDADTLLLKAAILSRDASVVPSESTNTLTITAANGGDVGNSIDLSSNDGTTLAVSGSTLTGGTTGGAKAQSLSFADSDGVYLQSTAGITNIDNDGSSTGVANSAACGTVANGAGTTPGMNVVREAKAPNAGSTTVASGQIGVDSEQWPFIQLYTLNPTGNVVIQYNKGGGAQSTTLTFDTVDQFAGAVLDSTVYTTEAQVHATITDLWLNIDPTDEDSWTFGTVGTISTNYQVFDENGGSEGDADANGVINIASTLSDLMCEDNCVLVLNTNAQGATNPVLTIQDNDDSQIETTGNVNDATLFTTSGVNTALNTFVPVTITENGPATGVFGTYDESDTSVLIITSNAARGTSASFDYNESPVTVLVGFDYAEIDIQALDDEWNSGEEIPITVTDGDANRNSRADEDLDLNNPEVSLIPSLVTGDPFTLAENNQNDDAVINGLFIDDLSGTLITNPTISSATSEVDWNGVTRGGTDEIVSITVEKFSKRANITPTTGGAFDALLIDLGANTGDLHDSIGDTSDGVSGELQGFNLLNLDLRSMGVTTVDVWLINNTSTATIADGLQTSATTSFAIPIANDVDPQSLTDLTTTGGSGLEANLFTEQRTSSSELWLLIVFNNLVDVTFTTETDPIVVDFFSFGFTNDGLSGGDRVANQIIRLELEETDDNSGIFEGSLEYKMVNQLTILDPDTYTGISPIASDPTFIVIEDLTDEDSPRVNYLDLGGDGVSTQVSDQEEAPSHSGVVSFDSDSYKTADTVIITLEDLDLNVDSDLIDIYTTVAGGSTGSSTTALRDVVGNDGVSNFIFATGENLGKLLDITFDDQRWATPNADTCTQSGAAASASNDSLEDIVDDTGLAATGFTLVETTKDSGVFMGDFQIPGSFCKKDAGVTDVIAFEGTTGVDIEVNYVDFRDASGEVIEVNDSAGVRANTGSISLDRTVYPVPFGVVADFEDDNVNETPSGRSIFPIHQTGMNTASNTDRAQQGLQSGEFLNSGDLSIHIRVNDPDFDLSASGEDNISTNSTAGVGPVKISVTRGSSTVILGHAGGPNVLDGTIDTDKNNIKETRQFGPMDEIAPDAGIFEIDIVVRYTDGPASTICPSVTDTWTAINGNADTTNNEEDRFDNAATSGDYCILQGDILTVEYTDPADASGDVNTVTDSATFDLRNGVLQSDKSVYIIGSDMILTLIEPDLDLDNDQAETYDLDLIEWDSDAATVTMGDADDEGAAFDPEPFNFRETGDSTGIFQIVIEIPEALDGDSLERGEEIVLEYTDWGPSGSDYVGDEDEDVNVTVFTSNFGATIELDQKVYTWTDKVYITIVAPDHNFDGDLVDEIGNTDSDPIKVASRSADIDNYKLVETGTDTGIFTGEVILTGFTHDADGDVSTGDSLGNDVISGTATGSGPTDGFLPTDDDDGLTVSFEFSEDETVVGSALIRWNIGEVQWLEASYPASGTGVVRVIDPDMNLNPESVDNFDIDVWSDSDAGGIDLTVTETNEATGIYEGTVFFTVTDESSGHRLRVAEGDTVTAEYEDNTLPDPYTTADELDVTATTLIGTVVPPLERAPAANLRTVDAFGNSLDTVSVDQQVQISADLANGQDREQTFAYLVQIQDGNGVTVSLAWITGSLSSGQQFSPALSWIPTMSGSYTATAFVWESVDNPTALSPPVSTTINVQ